MSNIMSNTGYIKLKITGLNLENFLFDLTSANVSVKNIKRKDKSITLMISRANYKLLNSLVQKYNLNCEVIAEYGFIQIIKRIPYCIGGILGIFFSIFLLWYNTNFISSVEIVFDKSYAQSQNMTQTSENIQEISQFLTTIGLKHGEKLQTDFDMVEKQVLAKFPFVKKCSVERTGTNIKIILTEAKLVETKYSKIVANKNCIITKITTFSGIPKVKAGDTVIAGQTLVESEGDISPSADIEARVWYTGTAWHFSKMQKLVKTGNVQIANAILFNNNVILPANKCKFEYYESSSQISYITTNFLPIKKQTIIFEEIKLQEVEENFEEHKTEVFAKAKEEAIKNTIGTPIECTYSVVTEGDTTKVDCFLLAIEKIGVKM